tara:strand:+ start:73 stop:303 length:231 start_codon:yes stop_codon:yes gene_type:complete
MPIYVCAECGYETNQKYRMSDHIEKKLPCPYQRIVVDKAIMDIAKKDLSMLTTVKTAYIINDNKNESKSASPSPEP